MDKKVGYIFTYAGVTLAVVQGTNCVNCYFYQFGECNAPIGFNCHPDYREDKKRVKFLMVAVNGKDNAAQ